MLQAIGCSFRVSGLCLQLLAKCKKSTFQQPEASSQRLKHREDE
jgi:hypothetical protein